MRDETIKLMETLYPDCWTYPKEVIDQIAEDLESEMVSSADIDAVVSDVNDIGNMIGVNYDELTFPVSKYTFARNGGKLYFANQTISQKENFTPAHWTEVTIGSDLADYHRTFDTLATAPSSAIGKAVSPKTISGGRVTDWDFLEPELPTETAVASVDCVNVKNTSTINATLIRLGQVCELRLVENVTPNTSATGWNTIFNLPVTPSKVHQFVILGGTEIALGRISSSGTFDIYSPVANTQYYGGYTFILA